MAFSEKDLDSLLWDWAAETIKTQESGFPSSYEIKQRVDSGVVFVPDYYPKPKICRLAHHIFCLERDLRNIIILKYLFSMKIPEIALECGCHNATIYRKLTKARAYLLDEMRNYLYKTIRV